MHTDVECMDVDRGLTATATFTAEGLKAAVNCSDGTLVISSVDSDSSLGITFAERLGELCPFTGLVVFTGLACISCRFSQIMPSGIS